MQQVVSAIMGTTPTGFPLSSGRSCCSTDAKYEFRSTNSQLTEGEPSAWSRETVASDSDAVPSGHSSGGSSVPGFPLITCATSYIRSLFAHLQRGNPPLSSNEVLDLGCYKSCI